MPMKPEESGERGSALPPCRLDTQRLGSFCLQDNALVVILPCALREACARFNVDEARIFKLCRQLLYRAIVVLDGILYPLSSPSLMVDLMSIGHPSDLMDRVDYRHL